MSMKPTRLQFDHWVVSFLRGNEYLHIGPCKSALARMSSLSAYPEDIAVFDKHAAELLDAARKAHTALAEYLKTRVIDATHGIKCVMTNVIGIPDPVQ